MGSNEISNIVQHLFVEGFRKIARAINCLLKRHSHDANTDLDKAVKLVIKIGNEAKEDNWLAWLIVPDVSLRLIWHRGYK